MKLYIALIPNNNFNNQVYNARKELVSLMLSQHDNRINTLPHACISYLKEVNNLDAIAPLKNLLENISLKNKISLKIDSFDNYGHKVVAMFNPKITKPYVDEVENFLNQFQLSGNVEYVSSVKTPVGDHLKIVRNVYPTKIDETKKYLASKLDPIIEFNRIVLIKYNCQEKDILWQKNLT